MIINFILFQYNKYFDLKLNNQINQINSNTIFFKK